MARIFSISFSYKDSSYNAIVAVKKNPFYTEYEVNMLDDELNDLLLSTRILSPAPGQFTFADVSKENYTPLMKEILNAVAAHIHIVQLSNSSL